MKDLSTTQEIAFLILAILFVAILASSVRGNGCAKGEQKVQTYSGTDCIGQ